MSLMSVPALDRLLEPSETELWSGKSDRRGGMNMSPLFPSQPHTEPSPPHLRSFPSTFSPSPYVLNFKRRVFDRSSSSDSVVKASCSDHGVAMPRTGGQVREAISSLEAKTEVVSELKEKLIKNKNGINEDGMLPVREVKDRRSVDGQLCEGQERLRAENVGKAEVLVTSPVVKTDEAKYDVRRRQDSFRGSRCRSLSIGRPDLDLSSISSSNREEFFDAPEDPFDDIASDEESLRAQRTPRSTPGGRRDVDVKLQLDQEIKRRMAAEDAMAVLQLQCTEMASHLASVDEDSRGSNGSSQNDWDSDSQAQKLVVAQLVAYSVARGAARAEVDEEMENVVAEKSREIARLRDKLHYYELVNHEMSQRNQEAFELARSRRLGRRSRNQWLMVCAGGALCVGISAVLVSKFGSWATSHFPSESALQSHMQTDVQHSSPSQ